MKRVFTFVMAVAAVVAAMANDSEYFMMGNQLIPMQNVNISVAKEVLTIELSNNGFTNVDVYYEFQNDGKEKDIVMGFEAIPPYFCGEFNKNGVHPYIKNFVVEMNGKALSYKNSIVVGNIEKNGIRKADMKKWKYSNDYERYVKVGDEKSEESLSYAYYFNAHFKPGKNIIHHTYSYCESYGVMHAFWIDYKLTPATRWANNKIGDFTLRITSPGLSKHYVISSDALEGTAASLKSGNAKWRRVVCEPKYEEDENQDYIEVSMRDAVMEWHATDFCPKSELFISSADLLQMYATYAKKVITSDKSDFSENIYYDNGANYYPCLFEIPDDSKDEYKRLFRNLPYASRGYIFKSDLKAFFEKEWWYMPDAGYTPDDNDFTEKEKKIIKGEFEE